jgi:hypothetical protein
VEDMTRQGGYNSQYPASNIPTPKFFKATPKFQVVSRGALGRSLGRSLSFAKTKALFLFLHLIRPYGAQNKNKSQLRFCKDPETLVFPQKWTLVFVGHSYKNENQLQVRNHTELPRKH